MLTGLLVFCLVNSVSGVKTSLESAEANVLEVEFEDDDKDDSREQEFAITSGRDYPASTEPSHNALDSVPSQSVRTQSESHLIRGPPSYC